MGNGQLVVTKGLARRAQEAGAQRRERSGLEEASETESARKG